MEFKGFSNKIDQWDQKIILKYNGFGGKPLTILLKIFSFFGRETVWLFLIVFYLIIWYDPFLMSYISATFLTGLILILAIKQIVKRARPFERFDENKIIVFERKPTSRSFPSWHSYNVMSQGLLFGLFFLKSPFITLSIFLVVIIVSFSRIQLGVHYPTDVIFGCIFGLIGFFLAIFLVGPLTYTMLTYLESFIIYEIEYRQINSMLFENLGYLLFSIVIFFIILLLAINKTIIEYIKND